MIRRFDIVIAGGGMVGLTFAALLRGSSACDRLNVRVLDAGPPPHHDPEEEVGLRVSAISPGSSDILTRAGCWDAVAATRLCPFRNMRVWDANGSPDGKVSLQFDAADFAVAELGFIVENTLIQKSLAARLEDSDTVVEFGAAISEVTQANGRFRVDLADGRHFVADLLVGADGSNSLIRRKADIPVNAWQYPQTALVTHLAPEMGHCNTAWQRFLPTGPIALLPLDDGRVSTVWSTTPELAQAARCAGDEELGRQLTEATDGVLGSLSPTGPRGTFDLRAHHASHYVLPGLALIGDAAHSVHPLAGQGVNLGLADAASLAATVIASLASDEYPGDLPRLRRFERDRKGANATMLHFIDGINRLFAMRSGPAASLRSGGMALFNASGVIRHRAVEVALGLR